MRWFPLDRIGELEGRLADVLRSGNRTRRRDALGVCLGLHGLRVGEVCRAQIGELYAAGRSLHVPPFKRGNARDVPLHQSLVDELLAWRASAKLGPSGFLLATSKGGKVHRTQFERFAARLVASVIAEERFKFHGLRHTFAMRLYAESRDLFLVKRLLGHRSITSTQVYADSLNSAPEAALVKIVGGGEIVIPPAATPGFQLRLFSPED
jgi:integrase/recombinase XerD